MFMWNSRAFYRAALPFAYGWGTAVYSLAYPLAYASIQGRSAFAQHRNDGFVRALGYAAGASMRGLGGGLMSWPRVAAGLFGMGRDLLSNPDISPTEKFTWGLGLGIGGALTAHLGYSFGKSAVKAVRGRGYSRLFGVLGLGLTGFGIYQSVKFAGLMHDEIGGRL